MGGYIDNYATPGNPVVDITGAVLGVLLNFESKGAAAPQDFPISSFQSLLSLPQSLLVLLQTPLNQIFDQIWSQNTDANGKTMRDRTSASIISQISSGVPKLGDGYSAYNIGVTLPTTGLLRSIVLTGGLNSPGLNQLIFLSYELFGIAASFTSTAPWSAGPFMDPSYNITFDIELLIGIGLPFSPGPLTVTTSATIENATISGSNVSADIADALKTVINFLSDQPTDIFQAVEGQIDASGSNVAVDLGQLSKLLIQFSAVWQTARSFGFTQLGVFIDGNARTLNIRLTHPVDPAPTAVNAATPTYPSLFRPLLRPSFTRVQVGGSLTVTGTNFPIAQANALYIGWNDTTSGTVIESDIMWGPAGASMQTVTKTRNGNDGGNTFVATNLISNTTYVFAVRDQDQLTETPFTQPPLSVTTQATDLLDLLLEYGGTQWVVGTATLTASGSFSATIFIPPGVAPGNYTLAAVLMGNELASTPIEVVSVLQPGIEVFGGVEETYPFTLSGAGFQSGTVTIFIDTVGGATLGTVPCSNTGAFEAHFVWPRGVTGMHSIVAQEIVGGQTLEASVTVLAEALPQ